jgi:uncharacterized protein YbaR (Trm112 family)
LGAKLSTLVKAQEKIQDMPKTKRKYKDKLAQWVDGNNKVNLYEYIKEGELFCKACGKMVRIIDYI